MKKVRQQINRLAGLTVCAFIFASSASADVLLYDTFPYPDGLITNEYAFWNAGSPGIFTNPNWEMDSGSFFCSGNAGWTGIPNDTAPNVNSSNGNNSSIFRLNTKRGDFGDVAVSFDLLNQGLNSSNATPPVDWDGLHIWLHYQTEYQLYYASINRRDNTVVIKKKVPGGPSNGGTYYELTPYVPHAVPYNTWQQVKATVKTNSNGTVTIELFSGSTLLISATDDGHIGGPPITGPGKVGIRGDNANLKFKNFKVETLGASVAPSPSPSPTPTSSPNPTPSPTPTPSPKSLLPTAPTGVVAVPGDSQVTVRWNSVSGATSYNLYRSRFPGVTQANGYRIANVTSPKVNTGFVNGTAYYFVVTAVNAAGESPDSAEVSAIPAVVIVPPAPPTGLLAFGGSNGQVTVRWNPVPGATSYNLYRSRSSNVNKTNGYKIPNVVSPKVNEGMTGKVYMVVTAVNAMGESIESQVVSAAAGGGPNVPTTSGFPNDLGDRRISPNPWRKNEDAGVPIVFDRLTSGATVKIFTVAGQWVKTLSADSSSVTWDLTNDSGEQVASGVYMCLFSDNKGGHQRSLLTVIQ